METIIKLAALVAEALAGRRTAEDVARALIDFAFDSGVAPSLLMEYLSAKARDRAELAADIAEFAKLEVQRMKGEGGL